MRSERRIELSGKVKNVLVVHRQGGLHRVALGDECERRLVEELGEFDRTFFGRVHVRRHDDSPPIGGVSIRTEENGRSDKLAVNSTGVLSDHEIEANGGAREAAAVQHSHILLEELMTLDVVEELAARNEADLQVNSAKNAFVATWPKLDGGVLGVIRSSLLTFRRFHRRKRKPTCRLFERVLEVVRGRVALSMGLHHFYRVLPVVISIRQSERKDTNFSRAR